jgi:hypothetical protein
LHPSAEYFVIRRRDEKRPIRWLPIGPTWEIPGIGLLVVVTGKNGQTGG